MIHSRAPGFVGVPPRLLYQQDPAPPPGTRFQSRSPGLRPPAGSQQGASINMHGKGGGIRRAATVEFKSYKPKAKLDAGFESQQALQAIECQPVAHLLQERLHIICRAAQLAGFFVQRLRLVLGRSGSIQFDDLRLPCVPVLHLQARIPPLIPAPCTPHSTLPLLAQHPTTMPLPVMPACCI